jgi:PhzF family phenazine biosynthesis protein
MKLPVFQIDAFTNHVFGGNPAAVVPLDEWLPDDVLQKIALENNLSETAFFVQQGGGFYIRWFTPEVEVNLCGHATLASSHVLFNHLSWSLPSIDFQSRSGQLSVSRKGQLYQLNFPVDEPQKVDATDMLLKCFDMVPQEILKGSADYLLVFDDEDYVRHVVPNMNAISKLDAEGVIITSAGHGEQDFVSRFFAPRIGIPEDPVTGSAHTVLVPYSFPLIVPFRCASLQFSMRGTKNFSTTWCNFTRMNINL